MTKIEQWQEWAKQYNDLREKLDYPILDFVTSSQDDRKNGHVKYDIDRDRIIIYTSASEIAMPVYAGRELLSVLKQLYEEHEHLTSMYYKCPKCGSTDFMAEFNDDYVVCKNCGKIPSKDLILH